MFYNIEPWAQCYKTFYVRNLRMFVISQSACNQQAFPAQSIVCGQGQELTLECSLSGASERFFNRVGSCITNKRQTRLEKLAREKHSSLLRKFETCGRKKFITLSPGLIILGQILREREYFIDISQYQLLSSRQLIIKSNVILAKTRYQVV